MPPKKRRSKYPAVINETPLDSSALEALVRRCVDFRGVLYRTQEVSFVSRHDLHRVDGRAWVMDFVDDPDPCCNTIEIRVPNWKKISGWRLKQLVQIILHELDHVAYMTHKHAHMVDWWDLEIPAGLKTLTTATD